MVQRCILVTGKGDARERQMQRRLSGMSSEDEGYGASRLVVQHHWSSHQVSTLLMISNISDTTHLNLAIDTLWLTQPWGSIPLSSSQVIRSSLFPFYLNFPWWVTVFCFITHFLFDLSSDSSCCSEMESSSDSLMSNHLQISDMLLSCHDSPKRGCLASEKDNQVQDSLLAQLYSARLKLDSSDYTSDYQQFSWRSWHFDYIIRVCLYTSSNLGQHEVSMVKNIFWEYIEYFLCCTNLESSSCVCVLYLSLGEQSWSQTTA